VCAVGAGGNKAAGPSNAAKLDADTENLSHQVVSHDFKVALQKARQAKKMTQKDLGMVWSPYPSIAESRPSCKYYR
jgi:ribosome-binding protein aMBF1 (putative translation factor)